MSEFPKLFEPGTIGKVVLKNRLVMAPAGTGGHGPEGEITDRIIDYYVERAKGGVGFIIAQSSLISQDAPAPGRPAMYDDKFIPFLKRLSGAVHQHDAKIAFQIVHHGKLLTQYRENAPDPSAVRALAPSPIPRLRRVMEAATVEGAGAALWVRDNTPPEEATKEDIKRLAELFAEAARRVKEAGFDAVEIHGGHGYLISQFLSPLDNVRTDEYGGSVEKRARFACEVIEAVRKKVGSDYTVIFRISGSDYMVNGITAKDSARQAPMFVEAGADALHISASQQGSIQWQYPSFLFPKGTLVADAAEVKKAVDVPVIAVGKLTDPFLAEKVLEEGKADFIAMARGLMADPELCNKFREGRLEDIRPCVYCLNCFNLRPHLNYVLSYGIPCTVNPAKQREKEFALTPTTSAKKVMVIGGGLAGMEAARTLAERGHNVDLYEKSDRLGGQWYIACQQEQKKADYSPLLKYLERGLEKAKVNVKFGTEVTPDLVKQVKPDAVVVATGAVPLTPEIEGVHGKNVVQAVDVILGKANVGQQVVVIGGRYLGMEIAYDLAEKGKRVTLTTRSLLGRDMERNLYLELRNRLIDKGVQILQNSPLVEIGEDGIYVAFNGDLVFLEADTVVLATGMQSENSLAEALKNVVPEVHSIGDAVSPRDALDAIHEGAQVAREI
ncbi:MAG: FAD-dependent oxidoreductase [Chloroflexota bacterium]|nr:FAD-dependent oxidoreductase [Chloroflexota bacterium]